MYKTLIYLLALLIATFQVSNSFAGNSTANATAGTGDYVYAVKTDGSGHFGGMFALCDGTALASCATVTGGVLSVTGAVTQSGTWNIGTVTTVTAVTAISNALPAGSNVIGHVIADTGSTTAVTQATASNLNATVVGTGTFPVQAAQSGTWNITNISGTVSLPTGASTSAKQPALGTAGSAATDVLTVQGIASMTPLLATLSGTNNINNISGTISLPTGAATATNQTNASQKTQIVDGSGNVIASTSNNLNVQCANCSGSGASAADAATFTAGTSVFAPAGGQFTSGGATACVTAHQCMVGMTAARAFFTDISSVNAVAVLTGTGAVGTGAQRIAVGTDTATIAGSAPGTAGSASTNVVSVQGIASMTPILANPGTAANWGVVAQGSTTSGQSGNMVQGAVTTSAPTYTTAQTSPLSLDTSGNLRVVGTGLAQGSTTSGQTGSLVMAAVTTSSPTYTTAQTSPLSVDTSGSLRVAIISGGGSGGTSIADAGTFTAGTTSYTPVGGQFTSGGATACVTGHACWVGMTAARAFLTDVSSVNSVTVLTGTGAVGTGAQRIAVGTDTATIAGSAPGTAGSASTNVLSVQGIASMTPLLANPGTAANWGVGATGSAPVANAVYMGGNGSGATGGQTRGMIICDQHAFLDNSTQLATIVAGVSGRKIYICGYIIATAGTATNTGLTSGTGTNCVTTSVAITPVYNLLANDRVGFSSPTWNGLISLANADNLCVSKSAANSGQTEIWYAII